MSLRKITDILKSVVFDEGELFGLFGKWLISRSTQRCASSQANYQIQIGISWVT
jgi:hypothetical protein